MRGFCVSPQDVNRISDYFFGLCCPVPFYSDLDRVNEFLALSSGMWMWRCFPSHTVCDNAILVECNKKSDTFIHSGEDGDDPLFITLNSGVHLLRLAIGYAFGQCCSVPHSWFRQWPTFPMAGQASQQKREKPGNQEDDNNRCYLSDIFYSRFFFFTTGGLRWSAGMDRCGQWQSSCVLRYSPKRFTKHGYFMIQLGQCCHSPIMAVPR